MIDAAAIVGDFQIRTGTGHRKVSFIELNRSGPPRPAIALLVFVDGQTEPHAFVKATSDDRRAKDLRVEFANLSRLQRSGDAALSRSVPAPIYCEATAGLTVLAETAKPGQRMKDLPPDSYFASRSFGSHLSAVADWLDRFRLALGGVGTQTPPEPAGDRAARSIERFRRTHRVSAALETLLGETSDALRAAAFPEAPWHGDFCTANLVVPDDRTVFVIDWEYPLADSWPLSDLLYFLCSTWCVPYRKGLDALKANYRCLFFEDHAFSGLLRETVGRHLRRSNIAGALLLPLSVITWVAYANRKHDELAALGEERASGHMPLIMIEDGACLNLEILAANRDRYLNPR